VLGLVFVILVVRVRVRVIVDVLGFAVVTAHDPGCQRGRLGDLCWPF
jgi:hypothetical protein